MALAVKLDESVEPLAEVVALQPVAIVDHVCVIDESVLRSMIQDEVGGSHRVEMSDIQTLLAAAGEYYSKVNLIIHSALCSTAAHCKALLSCVPCPARYTSKTQCAKPA